MALPRRRLSRWRVGTQVLIHLVLIGHVLAYYLIDWKQVGAIDFQTFFHHFLGQGLVTAGAVLAIVAYGSALVFGRLFCSWGCHFGATQDLAAWILRKLGWRPPLVRTRFLHWSPYLVLAAAFVLPWLTRTRREPWWPVRMDLAAVAPWDTLPGWLLSTITFAVCGAGILLFLGTRGFCRFVCPYGAVFRVTDRLAPYRIRRVAACASSCGESGAHPCTAACPTAINVHMETSLQGRVTAPDCVRCNLCVEACPAGALAHTNPWSARQRIATGTAPPGSPRDGAPGFRPLPIAGVEPAPASRLGLGHDLPLWGEVVVLGTAIATYLAIDVVYGGHFLAASLALAEGMLVFAVLRALVGRGDAKLLGLRLRAGRSWTLAGITAVGIAGLSLVPIGRAGLFQWYRAQGLRADPWEGLAGDPAGQGITSGTPPAPESAPAVAANRERLLEAVASYQRALALFPDDDALRKRLIWAHVSLGDRRALTEAEELRRRSRPGDEEAAAIEAWVARRFGPR